MVMKECDKYTERPDRPKELILRCRIFSHGHNDIYKSWHIIYSFFILYSSCEYNGCSCNRQCAYTCEHSHCTVCAISSSWLLVRRNTNKFRDKYRKPAYDVTQNISLSSLCVATIRIALYCNSTYQLFKYEFISAILQIHLARDAHSKVNAVCGRYFTLRFCLSRLFITSTLFSSQDYRQ